MDDQMLMKFYEKWMQLKPGPKAELRRIKEPNELLDRPSFYRFVASLQWDQIWKEAIARMIFCIPYICHMDSKITLGEALGKSGKVSEKRIYQVMRSEYPNDIVQLRRILQHIKPHVNWPLTGKQLYFWKLGSDDRDKAKQKKRQLLEDFVLNQPQKTVS